LFKEIVSPSYNRQRIVEFLKKALPTNCLGGVKNKGFAGMCLTHILTCVSIDYSAVISIGWLEAMLTGGHLKLEQVTKLAGFEFFRMVAASIVL